MQLSAIDLNLLVVLDALVETQSVKQAARRMSLSPSATSHALARLRSLLDDPLLVRSGRGLVLTPKAMRIRPLLTQWRGETERLLSDTVTFEPATARRSFVLATNDYVERVVLLPLGERLTRSAPGIDLHSKRADPSSHELRSAAIDLVLGPPRAWTPDVEAEALYEEHYVCLVRPGHPATAEPLTVERYASFAHVMVAPFGTPTSYIDLRLQARGLSRRVARTVATFNVAPHLVRGGDYVLTMAARLAVPIAAELGLTIVEAPFDVRFSISMAWHRRMTEDPAHRWLRSQVRAAVSGEPST